MASNNNFDLVLAIPCMAAITTKSKAKTLLFSELQEKCVDSLVADNTLKYNDSELPIKNAVYDNKSNLTVLANTFCEAIQHHYNYEMVFKDDSSNIKIDRTPILYGQVILYKDEIDNSYTPECCYNFFCVHSKLTINGGLPSEDSFNVIYFVVPDINYQDLTLLMDQSHELWCNIGNNAEDRVFLTGYLNEIGYKYFGKIYNIVFSDMKQYKMITEDESDMTKLFNILAMETYKVEDIYTHQINLSENTDDYILAIQGETKNIRLSKKEKFFDDYNMYSSYRAFASLYSYYYIINEDNRDIFEKRITPDKDNEDFSSEANILIVLETEIFKITACLVLSKRISEQMDNPRIVEIQRMFKSFITTRPLFEKLNYYYLGAQKEANFINKQFRIDTFMADYDHKRELLKNYSELSASISQRKNSRILNCIGLLFTFITGYKYILNIGDALSQKAFDKDIIIQSVIIIVMTAVVLFIGKPIKGLKSLVKDIKWLNS